MQPHDLERLLLGFCLTSNNGQLSVIEPLEADRFGEPANREAFSAIKRCIEKGITPSTINVALELSEEELYKSGGSPYLESLTRLPYDFGTETIDNPQELVRRIDVLGRARLLHTELNKRASMPLEEFQKRVLEADDPEQYLAQLVGNLSKFEAKEDGWQFLEGDDLFAPIDSANFIVDEILPAPSLSMLFGAPGSMKSMVLMDMAVNACAGRNWLKSDEYGGFCCEEVPVVWVILDSGKRSNLVRLQALSKKYGIEDKVKRNFHFLPFPKNPGFNAADPKAIDRICAKAERVGARLIIIDCLRKVGGGLDENDPEFDKVLTGLRDIADRTGAAVIFTHHTTKSNKGMYSGHHAIEANLDLSFGMTVEDNNVGLGIEGIREATFEWSKDRDGPYLGRKIGLQFSYFNKIVCRNSKELSQAKFIQIDVPENDKKTEKKLDKREMAIEVVKANPIDGLSGDAVKQLIKDKAKVGDTIARDVLDKLNEENYFTRVQRGRAILHYDPNHQPPTREDDF